MRRAGLVSLAFFYYDIRQDQRQGLRASLRELVLSLLVQLCHQSDSYCDMLFEFYPKHATSLHRLSDSALVGCLKGLLQLPGLKPVYIIVDALDECPNTYGTPTPREMVLDLICDLFESHLPNLHICVTSRPRFDIEFALNPLVSHSVSLHDESGHKRDIENYIKLVINIHPKNRRWKAEDKQLVIDVLTEKADGT